MSAAVSTSPVSLSTNLNVTSVLSAPSAIKCSSFVEIWSSHKSVTVGVVNVFEPKSAATPSTTISLACNVYSVS